MISELRVMRGPNSWSVSHHRLVIIKLDMPADQVTDAIALKKKTLSAFPSVKVNLNDDLFKCADGVSSSLIITVLVAMIGKELQLLAGIDVNFYDAHLLGNKSHYAVFEYQDEEVGRLAADAACRIIQSFLTETTEVDIEKEILSIKQLSDELFPGPTTNEIIRAANARQIPVQPLEGTNYTVFGQGIKQKIISGSILESTSDIAIEIAGNKQATKKILTAAHVPVPKGIVISDVSEIDTIITAVGFPVVIKPLKGNHGKGITTNINNYEQLILACHSAKKYSEQIIAEQYIRGNDYRFLVVGYKFIAAVKRTPLSITGDGVSTIEELIETINADPLREPGNENILSKVVIDQSVLAHLELNNLSLHSVLETGREIFLKDTTNLNVGGTAIDVTTKVHPENILMIERVARLIGLDVCGIDIIAPYITQPFFNNGGMVIEVNASPALRHHFAPSAGTPVEVGKAIIQYMFPGNDSGRIPVVAVTGTNGKTTTTRLIAHIAKENGFNVGFTSTEGIYLNDIQITKGDCSGPESAQVVLSDPTVNFAVLECARGGIIRTGLATDKCDIGIITNVAEDHLGLKDINTLEDMAAIKSVVPQAVKESGYAILNCDDHLLYEMSKNLQCNVAFFSLSPENPRMLNHCKQGGLAITKDNSGNLIIINGRKKMIIENVKNIPLTMAGYADFMTENVMSAVLASHILNFSPDVIRTALKSFIPSAKYNPGRLNIFKVKDVNVMIDYAHNPHGFRALGNFMKNISTHKTGIITAVGDRRNEDITEMGKVAATIYDRIIIRLDDNLRGRTENEILHLIESGIKTTNPELPYTVIHDTKNALKHALGFSSPGSYIVFSAENVMNGIKMISELQAESTL